MDRSLIDLLKSVLDDGTDLELIAFFCGVNLSFYIIRLFIGIAVDKFLNLFRRIFRRKKHD